MAKKKERQALAYLKEKRLKDLKNELLIMKLSHLLSMIKIRFAILAGIDIFLFLFANAGTNLIKHTFSNLKNILSGEMATFGIIDVLRFWNHAPAWYLVIFVLLVLADIRVYFIICTNYRDINKNQKGSIRWSTLDEIREQYPAIPLKQELPYQTFFGKGGIPVCQHGTHYNDAQKLCDINKGVIYIDQTPVNNLILGITRSGKGEMFVFTILDIYSRAENKYYTLNYRGADNWDINAADVYYDYRDGGMEKRGNPETIDKDRLSFGKKEFLDVLNNYEIEYGKKPELPEGIELEGEYSFFDNIDKPEDDNLMEDINKYNAEDIKKLVASKEMLHFPDAITEEKIEEAQAHPEKVKTDYLSLLQHVAQMNRCNEFAFHRNYQASMIVSDPKLELFIASKPILELRGYDVYCLNLVNPYESSGYNPLKLITDTYKAGDPAEASAIARSLATAIFAAESENSKDNAFFYDNAAFLTAALIMSEVIDELRADEEANKEHLQRHMEATIRFDELDEAEKEAVIRRGKELEELKKKRYLEKDTYSVVMMDREIEKLTDELKPFNYKKEDFKPRNDNEKKINLPNVLIKFTMLAEKTVAPEIEGAEPKNALDIFFQKRDSLDVARNLYSAIQIAGGERVKGSVYSTVLSKLTGFMDDKIKKMTAFSSFQLESIGFGKRPVAVFMSLPDYDNSNAFIQSIFISQCYYALAKKATINGGKCKREVIFLLDEFGNLPAIANMSSMITVCLGRNIRFNLIVQAYSQLKQIYGEHDSDTIYGNCGNQIYIQTDNLDTAKQYSELIGKETITTVTRMGGEVALTTQKQYTESVDEKPLLDENELMEFVEGECVVKRVMMRKDLINQKVKPRPIFNHGETAFPLRYQYLSDWYNTENKWENLHAESCAGLDLKEYVSDFDRLLSEIEYSVSEEYQLWYRAVTENYEKNKSYPIGEFLNCDEIERKLRSQVSTIRKMKREQLHKLTISDIERYYIMYESNLPAFRQRMYEISDWERVTDKTMQCFSPEFMRFVKETLGDNADEVWEAYNLDDEETLLQMTTEDILEILKEQDVPDINILQVKTAMKKYEMKEGLHL